MACQPFSHAGKQLGVTDERWMWPAFADCLRVVRPAYVVVENVAALVADADAFGHVLGDLAEMGFDAEWGVLRASDVGAPHQRARLFLVAAHADDRADDGQRPRQAPRRRAEDAADARSAGAGRVARAVPRTAAQGGWALVDLRSAGNGSSAPADTEDERHERSGSARRRRAGPADSGVAATNASGERCGDREGQQRRVGAAERVERAWGPYEPAVRRWERIHGPAPEPLDERGRLNPDLPEWMMGLPAGWTEGARTKRLKAIGNAVVPHVAALAWSVLASRLKEAAA